MFRYAPRTLMALAKSRLLQYHASSLLRHVLRNDGICSSCRTTFGGYIFLPTAERICLLCLNGILSYRMIPYHILSRYQLVPEAKRHKLAVMHADPNFYWEPPETDGEEEDVQYLVSVKQMRLLNLSPFQLEFDDAAAERLRNAERQYMGGEASDPRDPETYRWLVEYMNYREEIEPLPPFEHYPQSLSRNEEDYPGKAYTRFPNISMTKKIKIEYGYACFGCWFAYELLSNERYPARRGDSPALFVFIPDPRLIHRDRLRRTEDMLEHIVRCPGIKRLREGLLVGARNIIPIPWGA